MLFIPYLHYKMPITNSQYDRKNRLNILLDEYKLSSY